MPPLVFSKRRTTTRKPSPFSRRSYENGALERNLSLSPGAETQLSPDKATSVPALVAIARDASAPYDTRVRAAQLLASAAPGTGASDGFGSAELSLLATPNPTAVAVRQPYFVAARLGLRQSRQAPTRKRSLHEAIAFAPNGLEADRTRLTLLATYGSRTRSGVYPGFCCANSTIPPP